MKYTKKNNIELNIHHPPSPIPKHCVYIDIVKIGKCSVIQAE